MSGVLVLALRRMALSHGTVRSAVPVGHADRVEALDERREVLEDNYQRISDRMYELKLHRRELIAESLIVLLLFAEAMALLFPLLAGR
jgi:hypothetical protein